MDLTDELILELIEKRDIATRNKIAVSFLPFINSKVRFFCKEKRCNKLKDDLFGDCQEKILHYIFDFDNNKVSEKFKKKPLNKIFFSFINYKISYFLLESLRVSRNSHHSLIENKIKKFKTTYFKEFGFNPSDEDIIIKFNLKRLKLLYYHTNVDSIETIDPTSKYLLSSEKDPKNCLIAKDLFIKFLEGYSIRTKNILIDKYIYKFVDQDLIDKYNLTKENLDTLILQFKQNCKTYLGKENECH